MLNIAYRWSVCGKQIVFDTPHTSNLLNQSTVPGPANCPPFVTTTNLSQPNNIKPTYIVQ